MALMNKKVVFLDRDGVINQDRDEYVQNTGQLHIFPYSGSAIKRLNDAGFSVYVVSNQQGIAKGLVKISDLEAIEYEIIRKVEEVGGKIDAFYYCTHLSSENCFCRKPKPGMILKAAKEHNIDLKSAFMIGDTEKDVMAAKSAGCRSVVVLTGYLTKDEAMNLPCKPEFIADNLEKAVDYILLQKV